MNKWLLPVAALLLSGCNSGWAQDGAEFTVTTDVLQPRARVEPVGVNGLGDPGGHSFGMNNFIFNPGNEPMHLRKSFRIIKADGDRMELDQGGAGKYSLWSSGFLSGARARVYRLVDKNGQSLPPQSNYLDLSNLDHMVKVRDTHVLPKGSPGFPKGGWVVTTYSSINDSRAQTESRVAATANQYLDTMLLEPGRTYYYTVMTGNEAGVESASNETSAVALPPDPAQPLTSTPGIKRESKGSSKTPPEPATNLRAELVPGGIKLSWDKSASPRAAYYRVVRAEAPKEKQEQAVYLEPGGPPLMAYDYVVFDAEKTDYVNDEINLRVRQADDSRKAWHWTPSKPNGVEFSLATHDQPLPAAMVEPGRACLQVKAKAGLQAIRQTRMRANDPWYVTFTPGQKFRLEVWMRQGGLGANGKVSFGFSGGEQTYPTLKTDFQVTDKWARYTYDFVAPQRPTAAVLFGPEFSFSGPGTLWMDNARLFQYDTEADLKQSFVPGRESLEPLLAAQPATGPKGVLRVVMLDEAPMATMISRYPASQYNFSWFPNLGSASRSTITTVLEYALATGDSPEKRMVPWLTLQVNYSEEEWQMLGEYLGTPYDPAKDTPQTKPWAYKRFQQRGNGRPWTDEFREITLEFGNETWHNGQNPVWFGYGMAGQIAPGSTNWQPEMGAAFQYFLGNISKAPGWNAATKAKVRLNLAGFYDGAINKDGTVTGYAEVAKKFAPIMTQIGHANYVGPKWETNDKMLTEFNDDGLQSYLLSWWENPTGHDIRVTEVEARKKLLESGVTPYDLTAYEGGPGGFFVPGSPRATPANVAVTQRYGKSLASAVAAMDTWMDCSAMGFTQQAYFTYSQGINWSSHSSVSQGFVPAPGWLAMTLRNRYAAGDLMKTTGANVPQIQRGVQKFPLLGCWAMRDGKKLSVIVVSRTPKDTLPLTLHLPFKIAAKITLHRITGPATAVNMEDKHELNIEDIPLPASALQDGSLVVNEASGAPGAGMPPASVFLYEIVSP